jgi:hypothetical protein
MDLHPGGDPMSVETVTFVVDGPWLTNLVRSLWAAEGEPVKALEVLRSAFPTMSESQRIAICTGTKKLEGTSRDPKGIGFVDDNATEVHGCKLSLAALIERLDQTDEMDRWKDALQMAIGDVERVASHNGMIRIPRRRVRDYRNGKISAADITHERVEFPTLLYNRAKNQPTEDDEPEPPEPQYSINHPMGWLSPDGRFYQCGYMEHLYLIERLGFDDQAAEKAGWIKINGDRPYSRYHIDGTGARPTQRQIDLIFDWCSTNGIKTPSWLTEAEE